MFRHGFYLLCLLLCLSCQSISNSVSEEITEFQLVQEGDQIKVLEKGGTIALVIQNAQADFRPYLHPILAPGTHKPLTQYSPDHHRHQTGLYWGFTRVNGSDIEKDTLYKWFYRPDKPAEIQAKTGRDFFHHPEEGYWKRIEANVLIGEGQEVKWNTLYHMLDEEGNPILEESQTWLFHQRNDRYLLELEWKGKALVDITINEFEYGGLFLRMPWSKEIEGEAVNAARQKNAYAEGQRAMWLDVGMEIEGQGPWGHIAIFDHPDNAGFPQTWRVDGQLGVGPVRARMGDWHIKEGETETIRHQIVAYNGKHNDVEMREWWADYVEDHGMYNAASLWGIAQKEALEAEFLDPEAAVAKMDLKEGYQVNAFAAEPMISQPMAFCWDDKGRLWIAENRDYESRGYGFSNSGDSRILILEDTDRDGKADKRTVFLEGIPFPSAIAVGFGGLYLGAPPNLLFVPDTDQNDQADEADIQVLLTGWGIRDRHETINSLHWGPDGWLYGLEGFATPSKIRKPAGKGRIYRAGESFPEDLLEADGIDINGGVWRYHPIKHRFEVVAHGFSNPWGIDYDAKGQLFISACVIPHLFHVVPGGIYHRQGGQHFNPYVYDDIQTIVDHRHRSAHGGARVYLSDAFPKDQYGRLFMANIHEHAVLSDVLHPNGSGFTASHGEDFLLANNAQWIGFSMEIGPEGGLYVLDWHDADICGKEVHNKETGRVFRIMPAQSHAENWEERYDDLGSYSNGYLISLQSSPSVWHARRARTILQYRASQKPLESASLDLLQSLLQEDADPDHRLRALWTLHICNQLDESALLKHMGDKDPYIRAWAIQFLGEDQSISQKGLAKLNQLAKKESSPVVRLYLAGLLQRMELKDRWSIAQELVQQSVDSDDPNIPYMLWFAIEPLVEEDPQAALKLAQSSQILSIQENISRRLVDADQLEVLIKGMKARRPQSTAMLEGMLAGLNGRSDLSEPPSWGGLYDALMHVDDLAPVALEINQQFGNAAAAAEMIAILKDINQPASKREKAIQSLAAKQRPELQPMLPELLDNPQLRLAAIRAVAAYQEKDLGEQILKMYPDLSNEEKQAALQTLASRPEYGWPLAIAIKKKEIAKKEIPAYIALQLRRVVGNGFVEIWGPIDHMDSDKQADYAKYQRLLSENAIRNASPERGEMIFQQICGTCHQMYGEGGTMGPDLTGSNRGNTAYLLSNIIDPSGVLQDDYRMVILTTQDGRTYGGKITAENERQLTLQTISQEEIQLNKSDIQSQETSEKSIMPEGMLNNLTDREILDLVAYLKKAGDS